jgi:alcohol dehydrogenase class IV
MVPFSFETPRVVHFGTGALEKLGAVAAASGKRTLVLSGAGWFARSPWRTRIAEALHGATVEWLAIRAAEPSTGSLEEARASATRFNPDLIVAVGGGSVLDSGKALSGLLRATFPVDRYLEGTEGALPVAGPGVPWIAIPTTAGTGAEVTKNAVVKSDSLGVKRSMRSPFLLASAVIVDPGLAVSLPRAETGTSGLDALTQLVEAYVTRAGNPFVRSIVEGAFPLMLEALSGLPAHPDDQELRAKAGYGALMSGIALANAGLGAAHGFAAAVGGLFEVPHGLACAVFLPHVLKANAAAIRQDIARLARTAGGPVAEADPVTWLGEKVREIQAAFGLPTDLRGYHIAPERIREAAEKSSGTSMRGNPKDLSIEERIEILSRVI